MLKEIGRFYAKSKFFVFLHYKVMAESLKISQISAISLILWSTVQDLSLIFTAYESSDAKIDVFFANFLAFIRVFQPLTVLNSLNSDTLYVVIYVFSLILSLFLIVYCGLMHYSLRNFKEKRYFGFHFPLLDQIKLLTMIWLYVLAIPVAQLFYSGFYCVFEEVFAGTQANSLIICAKSPYFLYILVMFWLFPLIIYGVLSALFFIVEKFEVNNNLANSSSNFNLVYFLYKFFLVVMNFEGFRVNFFAILVSALVLQLILLKILLVNHGFFNFFVEKALFSCLCGQFFTVAYLVFLRIISRTAGFEMLYFVFSLIFVKFSLLLYTKFLEFMLDLSALRRKSFSLFEKRIKFLYYFLTKQDFRGERVEYDPKDWLSYLVQGSFSNHARKCQNIECFCHSSQRKVYDYKLKKDFLINKANCIENFSNIIFIKHFLRFQYTAFLKNFRGKNSALIKLKTSNFLANVINNYHKSVVECIEIKEFRHKNVLSLQEEFLLERILMDMDCILLNLNRNYYKNPAFSNLNFEELMQYESNFLQMERTIHSFASTLSIYYANILDERPDFATLFKNSAKLISFKQEIQDIYVKNHANPRTIVLYKEYLLGLLFTDEEEVHLSKLLNIKQEKIQNYKRDGRLIYDVELMYNENSILIQISTTNSNLGNIYKANKGAAKYLGYSVEELESSNINVIMPKRIHENHDQYLKNYMESGRGNVLYVERRLFLRKKNGFLSYISLITKPMFDLRENIFKFVGYMQPLKDEYELIVTDETGIIDGMSRKLGLKLKIFPHQFEKEKIYIQSLCPSLAEYYFERAQKQAPVYEYDFATHPKSSKNFPILKFFQYAEVAGAFKFQIDSVMRSLGDSIKKSETFRSSLLDPSESPRRTVNTQALSKRWQTTRHQIEKNLDFFLLECKLNILIPSDNSIEVVFFFVKEVDLSEMDHLDNCPIESEHTTSGIPEQITPQSPYEVEESAEPLINSKTEINFEDDVPNLEEKMGAFNNVSFKHMPPKPSEFSITKQSSTEKNKRDSNPQSFLHRLTYTTKLSPTFSLKKSMRNSSKVVETYKTYIEKKIDLHKAGDKTLKESEQKDSKMKNSEKVFQYLSNLRKNNENLLDNDIKSEQNSTTSSTMALSKKFLKTSIRIHYVPPCFTYLKNGLIISIFLIYVSQIINTFFVATTYNNLQSSFQDQIAYNRISPLILRTLNTSYRLILLKWGVFAENEAIQPNLEKLLHEDGRRLMECVTFLNENKERLTVTTKNLYVDENLFVLDEKNTVEMKLIDALVLYVSKIMTFVYKKEYSTGSIEFFFLIKNYQTLLSALENMDDFQNTNKSLVSVLEIECLCLVFVALALLLIFMAYRIKYYIACYQYINKIFNMLVHISNESLNSLKTYINEALICFKNDKQARHYFTNKMGTLMQSVQRDERKEKENRLFQRKNKSPRQFSLPLGTLIPFNCLVYVIILAGYIALLTFSNIFTGNLSDKVMLREHITPNEYISLSVSMTYMYDSIAENSMKSSFFQFNQSFLTDFYHNESDFTSMIRLFTSPNDKFFSLSFAFYQNEDFCQTIFSSTAIKYPDFFGPNYFELSSINRSSCDNIINEGLTYGYNRFHAKIFQNFLNIVQFSFYNQDFPYPAAIMQEINENNLAIEIIFLRLQVFERDFVAYESDFFQSFQGLSIAVVSLEFLAFFICTFVYWKTIDVKLKKTLAESRFCFDHFPLSLIMKQTYIMKYLQETSSKLL